MNTYEQEALQSLRDWERKMQRRPGLFADATKGAQNRINRMIPEKVHEAITSAFRAMIKGLLTGADVITAAPVTDLSLQSREALVRDKIRFYQNTAAAEGALTGAGGILLGLADLPLWLSIKVKMLSDIAAIYGHDTGVMTERFYLLQIIQLQFSSQKYRREVFRQIQSWDLYAKTLPQNPEQFDWRRFQQEYRDYLDIAKLLQLIPGIGAVVGAVVNHQMTEKLGATAMQANRLRWFQQQEG